MCAPINQSISRSAINLQRCSSTHTPHALLPLPGCKGERTFSEFVAVTLPSPSQVRRAVIIIEYSGRGEMTQGCLNMTQGCLTAMDSRVRPNSQDPQSHGLPELNIQVFMLRIFHSASLIVRFRNLMDTATHWCSTELSTDRSSSKPRSQTLQACILSSAVPEASCSVHLIGKFGLIDAAPTTMTTVAPATGEHELD
jgi:hypothetical protein